MSDPESTSLKVKFKAYEGGHIQCGWSLQPQQSFQIIPIPTSKGILYRTLRWADMPQVCQGEHCIHVKLVLISTARNAAQLSQNVATSLLAPKLPHKFWRNIFVPNQSPLIMYRRQQVARIQALAIGSVLDNVYQRHLTASEFPTPLSIFV